MRTHLENVKLGSRGVWSRVLTFGVGVFALSGCIIVDGSSGGSGTPPPVTNPGNTTVDPMLVDIDSDVSLDSTPGDGVGVFVEYYSGGRYRIWTTCDTNFSGVSCPFDIYTSVDGSSDVLATVEEDLEKFDSISVQASQGIVDLHFDTDVDYDAVTIDVTPGATLRVEAYIDGNSDPRFVYWFGNGVLHEGAPTNPVDFFPTIP